ncbi:MAG: molybdopterin converting factor subunit 1 [Parvularculaceae bacterium]
MRVLFFGNLRELAGTAETSVPADIEITTVQELAEYVANGKSELQAALCAETTKAAINAKFADFSSSLNGADEVAFMPPFSGG